MVRLAVLLLLLANGLYFAWAQGLLRPWGLGAPVDPSEPQRMERQLRPDALRVLPRQESRRPEPPPVAALAPQCLQAGLFDDAVAASLRQALAGWPAHAWSLVSASEPARWILYMGKYASPENVARKKAELRQIGVTFEDLANADLEPGLSLGGFASEAEALQYLERLSNRGVRTARVVQERAEARGHRLMLPAVDDGLRARLEELRVLLAGQSLRPCR